MPLSWRKMSEHTSLAHVPHRIFSLWHLTLTQDDTWDFPPLCHPPSKKSPKQISECTVVNDLRIRPQMAKFILTKWPHGSSLHTYRVPPGPLDQPWCTPIVSYSNRYTPTPELLGSLLMFLQAIFNLPLVLCYLMYLNVWWCKLTLTYRAK